MDVVQIVREVQQRLNGGDHVVLAAIALHQLEEQGLVQRLVPEQLAHGVISRNPLADLEHVERGRTTGVDHVREFHAVHGHGVIPSV